MMSLAAASPMPPLHVVSRLPLLPRCRCLQVTHVIFDMDGLLLGKHTQHSMWCAMLQQEPPIAICGSCLRFRVQSDTHGRQAPSEEPSLPAFPGADTEGMYTVVQHKLASKFGKEFTWALKSKMMGLKVPPAGRCC
jgi:hypothetical protein